LIWERRARGREDEKVDAEDCVVCVDGLIDEWEMETEVAVAIKIAGWLFLARARVGCRQEQDTGLACFVGLVLCMAMITNLSR